MRSKLTKFAIGASIMLAMAFTFSCSSGDDNNNGGGGNNSGYTEPAKNCTVVRDPIYISRSYITDNGRGEYIKDEVLEVTKGYKCEGMEHVIKVPIAANGDTLNVSHADKPCGDARYPFIIQPYSSDNADKRSYNVYVHIPNPNGPCKENE